MGLWLCVVVHVSCVDIANTVITGHSGSLHHREVFNIICLLRGFSFYVVDSSAFPGRSGTRLDHTPAGRTGPTAALTPSPTTTRPP